ncbi:acetylcholine receptor subunit beta-type unc-29-like [Ostrea edulis]|uniref:acetylcholine receptor subunit beta-type unc-29-like n=1 Tax=Ostrea edulis TaxID=37623 RepID=UPI0024AED40C|nr:acetylcholine receptor subunit beta-type unc-29-like [Ostrea edulis]
MSSVAYFTFTWTDDRLKWNHMLNYSSVIKAIYSTEDKLFIPPVVVENSVSNLGLISVPTLPIEIKSNGFILWSPGDIYETSCDIDTTFYPFDKQTCIITLTTRGYSKDKLNLELGTVPIVWSAYKENGEWTVVTSSSWVTTTDRDRIPYSQINFSFTFKRRTAFHLMNTIIPMFLLVSMTCFVFRIPVDAGEKLGYCLTVLLAFAVYLTLISDNIPTTSTHTSYLSIFMNVMLSLGVSSVILTIHIINIYFKPEEDEIPLYLKVLAKITARISFFNKERCCCKKSDSKVFDAVLENEDKKREIDAVPFVNTLYSWNSESSLRRDLFSSYEKDSRPSPTVDILCNIKLLSIKDLVSNFM